MNAPRLYTYYRSGAAHRVRIGLALKGVSYDSVPVHLVRNGGEHLLPPYRAINPQARVPALQLGDGAIMAQSPAILEYLEETIPQPPFLPKDPIERAQVRRVAAIIGCDIHPLNNVGPLNYLRHVLKADKAAVEAWYWHWIITGFEAVEALIRPGPYACGQRVTVADICLVPQVYNARRFKVPLDRFPQIVAVDAALMKLPAFDAARPENQLDAE